ncbi:hypothetical protein HYQ45_003269 [Verticillium longisporum]|uniref:Uncharacterized protein n=1 Tax=Verticillium longisporum TaxID=100787 RepID=A0A8I2ZVA9_VERLO|nr:hypothetical protein HYQ45_003269 [Verticillium longisporum]
MRRPQLLTPTELSRLRDRSDENDKLATCWDREHVGILLFDYSAPPMSYTGYPMLRVSLLKRGVSKTRHASGWCESERDFTFIGNVTNAPPRDYHYGKSSTYEQPVALMRNKIEEILAELGDRYATLCLCTARPKQLALGLQKIGLTIPKQFVVVHLVKVLEFQAVPDVINSVLAGQEGFAARANAGNLDWTGAWRGLLASLGVAGARRAVSEELHWRLEED